MVDQPCPQPTSAIRTPVPFVAIRFPDPGGVEPVPQGRVVGGAVDAALAVAQVWAEPGVGHARAASVGLGQVVQDAADAGDHVGDRRDVGRVFGVDEGGALLVAEAESPCRSRCVGVVDGHETGDRLLLEPLEAYRGAMPATVASSSAVTPPGAATPP